MAERSEASRQNLKYDTIWREASFRAFASLRSAVFKFSSNQQIGQFLRNS